MRKSKIFSVLTLTMLMGTFSSCSNKEQAPSDDNAKALSEASPEELQKAVADRDELLSLVNEISTGLGDIKNLESIMATDNSETPSQKAQIKQDIAAIQQALTDRRQRLEELEKKLSNSNLYTSKLQSTIDSMKKQIDEQTKEITRLTTELTAAKEQITVLDNKVDSLNTTVTDVTGQRDAAIEESVTLTNELNTCYVAVGSKNELKDHKILETGFLRKTKLMKGDFDQKFFTVKDKRTFTEYPLYAKKAKVLTNQPTDSYELVDVNGNKVLKITNPKKFWSMTNYLVIQLN